MLWCVPVAEAKGGGSSEVTRPEGWQWRWFGERLLASEARHTAIQLVEGGSVRSMGRLGVFDPWKRNSPVRLVVGRRAEVRW